jgi:phosphatidylserine/phosphatidylglycerophosphate/cardiolipin synthase-like enzyme
MQLSDILRQTFEDFRLTRSERRALREVFAEADVDRADHMEIRRCAFEIARESLTNGNSRAALDWLHDVVKTLEATQTPASSRPPISEALFSPGDGPRLRIASLFAHAHHSADVCVFTITDDRITDAIRAAQRRGIRVRIITDNDKSGDRGSDIDRLKEYGVDVRVDRTEAHMHHKYCLFDSHILLTGSYNWTRSAASRNEENIIVTNDDALVTSFRASFDQLWNSLAR